MTVKVELTNGGFALVDDEDEASIAGYAWHRAGRGKNTYAVTRISGRTVYMHRRILSAPKGVLVDHENLDGLDNRRCNIRLCSKSGNSANRGLLATNKSGFKGVRYLPKSGRWQARIKVNGRSLHLGNWYAPEHAAGAYDEAAAEHFAEFARFNFGPFDDVP